MENLNKFNFIKYHLHLIDLNITIIFIKNNKLNFNNYKFKNLFIK